METTDTNGLGSSESESESESESYTEHTPEEHKKMYDEIMDAMEELNKFQPNETEIRLNSIQLEYLLMQALERELDQMSVEREYGRTVMSLPVNYLQRAYITVEIKDAVMCGDCKSEIINPSYNQTVHKDCDLKK